MCLLGIEIHLASARLTSKSCAGVAGLCDGVVALFSACDGLSTLLSLFVVVKCYAFAA